MGLLPPLQLPVGAVMLPLLPMAFCCSSWGWMGGAAAALSCILDLPLKMERRGIDECFQGVFK